MDLFNEIDVYALNIEIAPHANVSVIIFSDPISLEHELKDFYYQKYLNVQDNINKYSFKYIGRFDGDSEYFDLACQGLQYSVNYS